MCVCVYVLSPFLSSQSLSWSTNLITTTVFSLSRFGAALLAKCAQLDLISTAVQNDTELVQVYSAACCIVECARPCSHTQTIHQTIWSPLAELHDTFRHVWRACQLPLEG